jgi:hypothetical protein
MIRVLFPAMVTAFVFSLPAQANPLNPVPAKQQAFKDAKAKLEGEIKSFVAQVEACSPPAFGADIIKGFTGPAPDSAWNALQAHEKSVSERVAEAEAKLSTLGDLRAACKAGGFDAKEAAAEAVMKDVQQKLSSDAAEYEKGQKIALQNEARVRQVLGARLRVGVSMVSTTAQVEGCTKALALLGEAGKANGPMRDADKALRESLAHLGNAYTDRVASIRDFGRILASQSACGGAPIRRAGLFPAFGDESSQSDEGEFQVADLPMDTGTATAR